MLYRFIWVSSDSAVSAADGRAALISGVPQDPELLEQSGGRMPLTLLAFVHSFASGLPTLVCSEGTAAGMLGIIGIKRM